MRDGVCAINMKGEILYVNPAMCTIFHKEDFNFVGKNIFESVPIPLIPVNDELIGLLIDSTMEKLGSHESVVDFDAGDGEVRKLRVCVSYCEAYNGSVLVIFTDLTELFRVNNMFSKYISSDIADLVLNSDDGDKLGGRLQNLSVIMSDIRGFTSMSERLPAKSVVKLLNHYYECMTEIIERNRGTLDDIMGDGMLIEFGLTKENDTHGDDAVLCALEMQAVMKDINAWNQQEGLPVIEMGIGINTGKAVVGNIGSSSRKKFTCIGGTINLSSRIEGFTKGGQVLVSDSTLQSLSGVPVIGETLQVRPKGISRDILLYEITEYNLVKYSE